MYTYIHIYTVCARGYLCTYAYTRVIYDTYVRIVCISYIRFFIHSFAYLSIYLSTYLYIYLPIYLSIIYLHRPQINKDKIEALKDNT